MVWLAFYCYTSVGFDVFVQVWGALSVQKEMSKLEKNHPRKPTFLQERSREAAGKPFRDDTSSRVLKGTGCMGTSSTGYKNRIARPLLRSKEENPTAWNTLNKHLLTFSGSHCESQGRTKEPVRKSEECL